MPQKKSTAKPPKEIMEAAKENTTSTEILDLPIIQEEPFPTLQDGIEIFDLYGAIQLGLEILTV